MNEFITWTALATYGGALAMVMLLTQFTKNLGVIARIPTQIWSYVLSLLVMYPAMYFTGQLNTNTAALAIFNAVIISIAANGGYDAIKRIATSEPTNK